MFYRLHRKKESFTTVGGLFGFPFYMENVLSLSDVMFEEGILWLNVLNVEWKSVLLERLGRWLEDQTSKEREQNSLLDSLSIVEKLSGLYWTREKSDSSKYISTHIFFVLESQTFYRVHRKKIYKLCSSKPNVLGMEHCFINDLDSIIITCLCRTGRNSIAKNRTQ